MVNEYCAQGLSLHLGKRQIIDNVSVALRGGEMTALIGPNGAGKSTLLRLLTGYLTPDSGTRHLAGKPLEAWSPEALSRRRAVMLQRTPCRPTGRWKRSLPWDAHRGARRRIRRCWRR